MSNELRFDGKVAVITGAGQGLGRAYALLLARRGAKVVVNDLGGGATGGGKSSAAADKVVEEIRGAGGTAVANYDSVEDGEKIVQTALEAFGRIDILVNNAGILRDASFQKMTRDDWELIFKVHVQGAFRVTHAAWPHMRDQGYGRILFTSSAAGIYGNFGQANYSAAKLGLVGLAQTLALEGEKKNIRVNALAPIAGSRLTETVLPKEVVDALKPEYVAALVGWLCHETCEETGGLFEVGGGFYGKLRWERAEGKTFKLGREINPEAVQGAWDAIRDFSKSTHPSNVAESLQPVMANLGTKSLGGNEFIDVDAALGAQLPPVETRYDERDLSLYALGVGAGRNPADANELHQVYERHGEGFWPLPTYGVIPAINALLGGFAEGKTVPGLNYGLDRILHGEQHTEVLRPLPPAAKLRHKGKVSEIWDKGRHAVVVFHVDSEDAETGEVLVRNDISLVVRGAGGWGGDRGPVTDVTYPERAPDLVVTEKTDAAQALLYRLSGDWNPLHVDPEFAQAFGFERPILHGLCTFGYVGRAVINGVLGGDPRKFKSIKVRFADSVFPGETLKTEIWKESSGRVLVRASVVERNKVVINNAAVELYAEVPTRKAVSAAAAAPAARPLQASETEAIFGAIQAHVAKHPELAKSVGNVYQFRIKNPDSAWVLDLKNGTGSVAAGTVASADCTLELQESDWLSMASGKADPQKLFMSGKLKITGKVMASQKLEFLTKLDRGAGAPPVAMQAAPAASAAPASETASIFGAIKAHVAKHPELVKAVGNVFQFRIKNPDSAWVLDLKSGAGRVEEGSVAGADCTLELQDADWLAMASGKADPQKLFMSGKLKITGKVMASQKLEFLTKLDRSAVPVAAAGPASASAPAPAAATAAPATPKFIERLQQELGGGTLGREAGGTLLVKVKDPDAAIFVDFQQRSVKAGEGTAQATLTLSDEALGKLVRGEQSLESLYQHGELRVDGDVLAARRLSAIKFN